LTEAGTGDKSVGEKSGICNLQNNAAKRIGVSHPVTREGLKLRFGMEIEHSVEDSARKRASRKQPGRKSPHELLLLSDTCVQFLVTPALDSMLNSRDFSKVMP
jgi:hypothetical protein